MSTLLKVLGVIVGGFLLSIPFGLYHAWLFTDMWLWFVVPLGLPVLSVYHAWGLMLLVGWVTVGLKKDTEKPDDMEELFPMFLTMLLGNALAITILYGFGYVIKGLM